MNESEKIELEVRRLIAEEQIALSREIASQVKSHREFLQSQFRTVIWSVGVIVAAVVTAGTFLVGRELSSINQRFDDEVANIQERLVSKVDDAMIRYAIKSELHKELSTVLQGLINEEEKQLTNRIQTELLVDAESEIRSFTQEQYKKLLKKIIKELESGSISEALHKNIGKLSEEGVSDVLAKRFGKIMESKESSGVLVWLALAEALNRSKSADGSTSVPNN